MPQLDIPEEEMAKQAVLQHSIFEDCRIQGPQDAFDRNVGFILNRRDPARPAYPRLLSVGEVTKAGKGFVVV